MQLMLLLLVLFSVATVKGLVCNTSTSLQHALADESVSSIFVPGRARTPPSVRTGHCNIDCSGAESCAGMPPCRPHDHPSFFIWAPRAPFDSS